MALLGGHAGGGWTGRRSTRLALAAVTLLTITGCVVLQFFGLVERPLAFSHESHLAEGMSCTDCHSAYEESDEIQALRPGQCALCHDELDADKEPDRRVTALFDGEEYRSLRAGALSDEVIFSHAAHVGMGASCDSCHEPILTNDLVNAFVSPRMDNCIQCHEGVGKEVSCQSCHTVLDTDVMPPNHEQQWLRIHGLAVRGEFPGVANDCALCHTESSCTGCHQDQAPQNHNNFFRLRGHGVLADMDRDSCATCHEPSSCDACHRENEPLSHKSGMFGGPMNTHCLSCHFPLQAESCSVCHKSTPSHLDAADQPPNHFPGMDCRSCHGVNAELPHVDNGASCTFCHK